MKRLVYTLFVLLLLTVAPTCTAESKTPNVPLAGSQGYPALLNETFGIEKGESIITALQQGGYPAHAGHRALLTNLLGDANAANQFIAKYGQESMQSRPIPVENNTDYANTWPYPVDNEVPPIDVGQNPALIQSPRPTFGTSILTYMNADLTDLGGDILVEFGFYGYGVPNSTVSVVFCDGQTFSTQVSENGQWFRGYPDGFSIDVRGVNRNEQFKIYQTCENMASSDATTYDNTQYLEDFDWDYYQQ